MTSVCPIAAARDAMTLLQSGRAAMAQRILEGLPALINAALVRAAVAYLQGQSDAHRIMAAARQKQAAASPPATCKPNRLDVLRAALADPTQRDRLRAALRMDGRLLDRVAAGGANLSTAQWRRLREVLA